jgi:hypothetical protein
MKINRVLGMALGFVAVTGVSSIAFADNVIVGAQPAAAAPAQAPAVVVQPSQPVAAQPVVVDTDSRRSVVHADVSPPRSYMGTIAGSAVLGGVAGALIGGAIYFLGDQNHGFNVVYWAAGGVLVGTGVGLTQILVQESRASQATALSSDPAPTFRLALYQTRF